MDSLKTSAASRIVRPLVNRDVPRLCTFAASASQGQQSDGVVQVAGERKPFVASQWVELISAFPPFVVEESISLGCGLHVIHGSKGKLEREGGRVRRVLTRLSDTRLWQP